MMSFTKEELTFWIGGGTPSSKNGRVWTGEYFVASKATQRWRRVSVTEWGNRLRTWNGLKDYEFGGGQRMWFDYVTSLLPSPLYIELEFHRKTKHRFDYINVAQTILDEMVTHTWIIDDDTQHIKPYFADAQYTPANPGVFIKVLEHKPQH